jgi:hypothetical protein
MKKFLLYSLLGSFIISGTTIAPAEAKHGHGKKHGEHHREDRDNFRGRQNIRFFRNNRVYVTQPQIINVVPAPVIYSVPLVSFNPGVFYFTTQSPAIITFQRARNMGYISSVNYVGKRWIVQIR